MQLAGDDRGTARRRALEHGLLIVLPAIWTIALVHIFWGRQQLAFDFHHYYWPAGDRTLHGLSPYLHGPWYPSEVPVGFVYPAPTAALFAVISIIPRSIGDWLFTALAIGAPMVTLRMLRVHDWRPYGLVMLWLPVNFGWQCANLSMFMLVAVAGMWRWRDRPLVAGLLLGLVVALKLFLLPLAVFFLATRRYMAAAYAVILALAVNAVAWLVIGLDEIDRYRHVLNSFTKLREDYGYSVTGLIERIGGGASLSHAIPIAIAGVSAAAASWHGRRGNDTHAFTLLIAASLVLTPILWLHYLVLLAVPIAIRCPRLHVLWFLPLLMWYGRTTDPSTDAVAVALVVACAVIYGTSRVRDRAFTECKPAPTIALPASA